jgi:hypothetical protein
MGSKKTPYSSYFQEILESSEGREVTALSAEERAWRLHILKTQWAAVDALKRRKFDRSHIHKQGVDDE